MFVNEEGEIEVGRIAILTFSFLAAIAVAIVYFYSPDTTTRPAGILTSLQLHESTFSRLTTVETSEGWYQVVGAVSASKGDVVTVKARDYALEVCIESKDGSLCYPVR